MYLVLEQQLLSNPNESLIVGFKIIYYSVQHAILHAISLHKIFMNDASLTQII